MVENPTPYSITMPNPSKASAGRCRTSAERSVRRVVKAYIASSLSGVAAGLATPAPLFPRGTGWRSGVRQVHREPRVAFPRSSGKIAVPAERLPVLMAHGGGFRGKRRVDGQIATNDTGGERQVGPAGRSRYATGLLRPGWTCRIRPLNAMPISEIKTPRIAVAAGNNKMRIRCSGTHLATRAVGFAGRGSPWAIAGAKFAIPGCRTKPATGQRRVP